MQATLQSLVVVLSLLAAWPSFAQAPSLRASLHRSFVPHSADLRQLTFSPDSKVLATSSIDSTVKLWRVADGTLLRIFKHPAGITSVEISPDGQWLLTGSYDAMVRIWRIRDGAIARTLEGHDATVWSVAFSPDGQQIASSGEDRTIRLWRAR